MPNVAEDLGFHAILDGINDALVCLLRHDQVQIVDVHSLSLADTSQAADHGTHRLGKDSAAFHLDESIVTEGDRKGAAVLALGREVGAMKSCTGLVEMAFPVEDGGRGSIAKKDGCIKVVRVK